MAQIFNIESSVNALCENPYQRPNVCDAKTFLTHVASGVQISSEARCYFTENPNGLDEITRSIKTDKDLKGRLAQIRPFTIRFTVDNFQASILDIIRLHRSQYRPLEQSHTFIHSLVSFAPGNYGHTKQSTKNAKLDTLNEFKTIDGTVAEVRSSRHSLLNTPFSDLYELFESPFLEVRIQTLLTLAKRGHGFALAALLRIYTIGVRDEVQPDLEIAARLADQLKQFDQCPVAAYARAQFASRLYELASQRGEIEKADALKSEYQQLMILAANLGHIEVRHILATQKLLGREPQTIDPRKHYLEASFPDIHNLQTLPNNDQLLEIIEVLCQQTTSGNPNMSVIISALLQKEPNLCLEILIGIILSHDHYRAQIDANFPNIGNKKAPELVQYIASQPTSQQFEQQILKNRFTSSDRISDLLFAEIMKEIKLPLDKRPVTNAFRNYNVHEHAKLFVPIMKYLLQEQQMELYADFLNRFYLLSSDSIHNLYVALIAITHYEFKFNNTFFLRASAVGMHETEYQNTIAGRLAYIETYEKLKPFRDKITDSIPTIMQQQMSEDDKKDIQTFLRSIDAQAEKAMIYPQLNKLEAKDKAKQRYQSLKAKQQ